MANNGYCCDEELSMPRAVQRQNVGFPAVSEALPGETCEIDEKSYSALLVRSSPAGIITYRATGEVVSVNPAAAQILGGTEAQIAAQNFRETKSWKAAGLLAAATTALATGFPERIETEFVTSFGKHVLLEVKFIPFEYGGDPHLLALLRDLTAQRNIEQAVVERERLKDQLTRIAASVPGLLYSFRLRADGSTCLPYASSALQNIFPLRAEELRESAAAAFALVHPDDLPGLRAAIAQSARTLEPFEAQFRVSRGNGSYIWVEGYSTPSREPDGSVLWHGFMQDVTERKRLEECAAERQRMLDSFFAGATAGLALFDRDLRFVRVNEALAAMHGLPARTHTGRTLAEVVPHVAGKLQGSLERVLATCEPVHDVEVSGETGAAPGQIRHWIGSFFPILGSDGRADGVGVIVIEITEQKHLEAQLLQAQKMECVGQLAGGIAHDFNNLLTVIHGYASLASMDSAVSQDLPESLKQITFAAERAASLTRQLLAFSRRQVMQARPLSLNDVVAGILKMLPRLMGEHITVRFEPADTPAIVADPGMIDQVLMNLALNARDAMPRGGFLTIRTGTRRVRPGDRSEAGPGEYVWLSVTDTGCGIAPEHLDKVFEPFFTTKEVGKGTGLGLATVYGIVKQHNGSITASSEPGKGTTFTVYFPAALLPVASHENESTPCAVRGGSETILLVEDEAPVRELSRGILEAYGYRVHVADCGSSALKSWKEANGDIQMLITDAVMPGGMSGRELATVLRKRDPNLRVALMSGYSAELLDPACADRDFAFLQKPFSAPALAAMTRRCLDVRGA